MLHEPSVAFRGKAYRSTERDGVEYVLAYLILRFRDRHAACGSVRLIGRTGQRLVTDPLDRPDYIPDMLDYFLNYRPAGRRLCVQAPVCP